MSRVRHRGWVPRLVPVVAVRAGLFSVLGTAVAGTVHHLAFDSSPSWGARAFAAVLLFWVAVPGAGHDKPLVRQLLLAAVSQVVVGFWFVRADDAIQVPGQAPGHTMWPSCVHAGWPVVVGHVLLTVLCAVLLHGMDTCRRRVLWAAGRELLRRLFAPVRAPLEPAVDDNASSVRHSDDRPSPAAVFLADAVVRRGPPFSSLLLAV
ncbi:hypothetical protein [Streptomyces sp. SID12501]|uniref:Uncharacterized protein n=1 Tax=Streptomyces sp. SID12501 TaxID=2706042 RepID=A0A6B3BUI1_9ACTN|nr:hypothetical protein [Streptomyces sp. SID12501]NEC88023.1 hypothetical protein [Streptomyces sp. SID12501]